MSGNFLTPNDLLDCVRNIIELVRVSTNHRIDMFARNEITKTQFEHISNLEARLLNTANQAANLAVDEINTDLQDAAKVLGNTSKDLEAVIDQLKNVNQFFGTLANLINIFSRISQAIAGGTPAIISAIVGQLNNSGISATRGIENYFTPGDTDEI